MRETSCGEVPHRAAKRHVVVVNNSGLARAKSLLSAQRLQRDVRYAQSSALGHLVALPLAQAQSGGEPNTGQAIFDVGQQAPDRNTTKRSGVAAFPRTCATTRYWTCASFTASEPQSSKSLLWEQRSIPSQLPLAQDFEALAWESARGFAPTLSVVPNPAYRYLSPNAFCIAAKAGSPVQ